MRGSLTSCLGDPRLKLPFAAHEMISVAVCIVITAGQLDTASPTVSRKYEVELVPVLGPRMSPGHCVVKLSVRGVGNAVTVKTAELQ